MEDTNTENASTSFTCVYYTKEAKFGDLKHLNESEQNSLLKEAPALNIKALYPPSFEKQNVSLPVTVSDDKNVIALERNKCGYNYQYSEGDRMNAATRAMSDIRHLWEMSLQTALKLFQLKIVPVATYGLENIWTHLS